MGADCSAANPLAGWLRPASHVLGIALVVFLALPALASPSLATEAQELGWTLEDLVGRALARNQGLAAARLATSVVAEDIAVARGQIFPRLDAFGKLEHFPIRERLLIPRHGRRADNPFESTILDYGLEVGLPLYTGGRLRRQISLAESRTAAARSRAELTRQELVFNVASGYYTALRLLQVVAAQDAVLRSLAESRRVGELQLSVGRIAPLDLLRIDARLSQAERDLAAARNAYARTLEVLKELVDVPPETPLEVRGELVAAPTLVAREALREQALALRPDLVALRQEIQAQREAVGIARARFGPSVDLKARYGAATGSDKTSNFAELFVDLRLPLYEGGVLQAEKRRALLRLEELQTRLRNAERQALAEVERAALDLAATEPRIEAARRAVEQARESLRVEREKFAQGRGTSNDLLLAEEALLRARTESAAAVADSQIALAALRLAAGEDPVPVE